MDVNDYLVCRGGFCWVEVWWSSKFGQKLRGSC